MILAERAALLGELGKLWKSLALTEEQFKTVKVLILEDDPRVTMDLLSTLDVFWKQRAEGILTDIEYNDQVVEALKCMHSDDALAGADASEFVLHSHHSSAKRKKNAKPSFGGGGVSLGGTSSGAPLNAAELRTKRLARFSSEVSSETGKSPDPEIARKDPKRGGITGFPYLSMGSAIQPGFTDMWCDPYKIMVPMYGAGRPGNSEAGSGDILDVDPPAAPAGGGSGGRPRRPRDAVDRLARQTVAGLGGTAMKTCLAYINNALEKPQQVSGVEACSRELVSNRARDRKALENVTTLLRSRKAESDRRQQDIQALSIHLQCSEQDNANLVKRIVEKHKEYKMDRARWFVHKQELETRCIQLESKDAQYRAVIRNKAVDYVRLPGSIRRVIERDPCTSRGGAAPSGRMPVDWLKRHLGEETSRQILGMRGAVMPVSEGNEEAVNADADAELLSKMDVARLVSELREAKSLLREQDAIILAAIFDKPGTDFSVGGDPQRCVCRTGGGSRGMSSLWDTREQLDQERQELARERAKHERDKAKFLEEAVRHDLKQFVYRPPVATTNSFKDGRGAGTQAQAQARAGDTSLSSPSFLRQRVNSSSPSWADSPPCSSRENAKDFTCLTFTPPLASPDTARLLEKIGK